MAIAANEKYSAERVEVLHQYLLDYAEMGEPIDYEILVDGFKVVTRTNKPELFIHFEKFVKAGTRSVEFVFFNGGSKHNRKYIFYFGDSSPVELGNIGNKPVSSQIEEALKTYKDELEMKNLKEENEFLQEQIDELEKENEALEKQLLEFHAKQSPLNGVLGEFGANMVERFIKRNPQLLANIPGGTALAGLIGESNPQQAAIQEPDAEITFKVKDQPDAGHETQAEDNATQFVHVIRRDFNQEEINDLLQIITHLSKNKSQIKDTLSLLQN